MIPIKLTNGADGLKNGVCWLINGAGGHIHGIGGLINSAGGLARSCPSHDQICGATFSCEYAIGRQGTGAVDADGPKVKFDAIPLQSRWRSRASCFLRFAALRANELSF